MEKKERKRESRTERERERKGDRKIQRGKGRQSDGECLGVKQRTSAKEIASVSTLILQKSEGLEGNEIERCKLRKTTCQRIWDEQCTIACVSHSPCLTLQLLSPSGAVMNRSCHLILNLQSIPFHSLPLSTYFSPKSVTLSLLINMRRQKNVVSMG